VLLCKEDPVAKKKQSKSAPVTMMALADAAAATDTRVIEVPAGGTLHVIVDVGPMTVPYIVRYGITTVIKSLVDRAEAVALVPGDQKLAWTFIHQEKNWTHTIGVSINNGAPIILESKSEANKDPDVSADFVVIRTGTE
jgi:hypothetical protein